MTKKKDIGLIIQFDDKEYSKEETIFLYQRFFSILVEARDIKISKELLKTVIERVLDEFNNH